MATVTRAEAVSMLEEAFMAEPGSLRAETAQADVSGWDSMGALMLMAELDTRFGLIVTPDQLRGLNSVQDVLRLLEVNGFLQS